MIRLSGSLRNLVEKLFNERFSFMASPPETCFRIYQVSQTIVQNLLPSPLSKIKFTLAYLCTDRSRGLLLNKVIHTEKAPGNGYPSAFPIIMTDLLYLQRLRQQLRTFS